MKQIITLFILTLSQQLYSATVGSFNVSIQYNNESRNLSFYVPNNYDSTQSYQLIIGLHGLGDNSTSYRDALINSLNLNQLFTNTIFVFPDGGNDQGRDFYFPAGDENIIQASIDYAKSKYNISNNSIILQGFSLGGRSALKYGLDNPTKFKGLLLNAPAIQGIHDLNNTPNIGIQYNYANADKIPIYVTVGEEDYFYNYQTYFLVEKLKENHCRTQFIDIVSFGHSVPNKTQMSTAKDFFNGINNKQFDLDAFKIEGKNRQCGNSIFATAFIQNNSDSVINSFDLDISYNTNSKTENWSGTLLPYKTTGVPIMLTVNEFGQYTLSVNVKNINNGKTDSDLDNNTTEHNILTQKNENISVVIEDFENDNTFDIKSEGNIFEWTIDTEVSKNGDNSIFAFNTIAAFNTLGRVESFTSPFIDISKLGQKTMTFDVAYNYHRFTPPYFTQNTDFTDTLEIKISTDCGQTYNSIYKKGGKQLAVATSPILNPLQIMDAIFVPKSKDWRFEAIDLTGFSQVQNALIRFDYISALGGSINIDNIQIGNYNLNVNSNLKSQIQLYPNPASNEIHFNHLGSNFKEIKIIDVTGKLIEVINCYGKDGLAIDVSQYNQGIYIADLVGENSTQLKFTISK